MRTLLPVCALLLLGGCASDSSTPTVAAPAGPVAVLSGDPAGTEQDFMGDEIHCQMQSIDGETVGAKSALKPGEHLLIAHLTVQGQEHVGVIRLLIPAARPYRIRAHRKDDAVTVTLSEEDGRIVATSTASLAEQMTFTVFVVQK